MQGIMYDFPSVFDHRSLIVCARFKPNQEEKTAFMYASDKGFKEIAVMLIEKNANIDNRCRVRFVKD